MTVDPERRALRTAAFATFLRARREQIDPEDFGLRRGGRRVAGLRREEVAYLAGVSNTWYTRLEQGADVSPSADVVDAIARALRLDEDEHRHMRRLAGLGDDVELHALPSIEHDLQELVDGFLPSPAMVVDELYDFMAWNEAYVAAFGFDPGELEPEHRNLLWVSFVIREQRGAEIDEQEVSAMIAHFRWNSVSRVGDPELERRVAALAEASPLFRRLWPRVSVSRATVPGVVIDDPAIGRIELKGTLELVLQDRPAFLKVRPPVTARDRDRLVALLAQGRSERVRLVYDAGR
jgi:transcriptional regulator with XRE-family HTH domain